MLTSRSHPEKPGKRNMFHLMFFYDIVTLNSCRNWEVSTVKGVCVLPTHVRKSTVKHAAFRPD